MNFYYQLRSKNANRPTTIYAIVSNNGKQYKIATSYKINPKQWDGKKCIINDYNNSDTNEENLSINKDLSNLYLEFQSNICKFAKNQITFEEVIYNLRNNNNMSNKKTKLLTSASALLLQGFNYLYLKYNGDLKEDIKESTYEQYKTALNGVIKYLRENPQLNKTNKVGQELLDSYYNYMIEKGKGKSRIQFVTTLLKNIINNVLCDETKFKQYNVKPIIKKYKIIDKRTQDDKKSNALTNEQVEAMKKVELESEENTARNIFMVEVLSGQRVSDNEKVVNTEINRKANTIKTKKEGTKAIIVNNDELNYYIVQLKNDEYYSDIVNSTTKLNKLLRKVALKSKLTDNYSYVNSKGVIINTTIDKVISSHWGRHTFITQKLKEGYSVEEVAKMSGHKDKKMVEEIYNHLTDEDNENMLLNAISAKGNKQYTEETASQTIQQQGNIRTIQVQRELPKYDYISVANKTDNDYKEVSLKDNRKTKKK